MSMFTAPASGGGGGDNLPLADINGHYVLVRPLKYTAGMSTVHGPADAIAVNVADLTTGTHHLDVMWFGNIASDLNKNIGETVLGKVAQGVPKPGKNAPWILEDATGNPEVHAAAQKWVAANPGVLEGNPITAPAPAAPTGLAASLI